MDKLRQKVSNIIESRQKQPLFSLATLLQAGSILYGKVLRKRQAMFDSGRLAKAQLPCPVVSIGNITVGGTGKTPMTLHLAKMMHNLGKKVVILSRGYKGAFEKRETVISDGGAILCDVRQAGDEPFLLARLLSGIPVVVGANRHAAGKLAIDQFNPDVILLDDGFQHQQLERDLNILLLDARAPFGNSYMLPRGSLREPISAIQRADVVVFTRCNGGKPKDWDHIEKMLGSVPLFRADHRPVCRGWIPAGHQMDALDWCPAKAMPVSVLQDNKVVAFAGLAHNRLFWNTISELGGRMMDTVGFSDHHNYSHSDLQRIVGIARKAGAQRLVTTDKDLVRMPVRSNLPMDLIVMGVSIDFAGQTVPWQRFITDRITQIIEAY